MTAATDPHPMVSEEMVEVGARAMALNHWPTDERWKVYLDASRAALTAVLPLIGEACAKVARQKVERYFEGQSAIDVRLSLQEGYRWNDGPAIADEIERTFAIRTATAKEVSRG